MDTLWIPVLEKAWLQLIDMYFLSLSLSLSKKKREKHVENVFDIAPMFQRITLQVNHIKVKRIFFIGSTCV